MAKWQFKDKTVDELPFLTVQLTFPNLINGNSVTVLLLNRHLAIQTQTQMQTEPEAYRMHRNVTDVI